MEYEEVSWVSDASLEFLAEADGVGELRDSCGVDLLVGWLETVIYLDVLRGVHL